MVPSFPVPRFQSPRGHATTTHYTHHQVSLMVLRYTTLVPSLGLRIGPACEAGLSAGMRRERVEPPKEKEKERVRGAPLSSKNGKGIPVSPCCVLEVERSKLSVMDRRKRKLFVAVTAPKIVRLSLSKDQNFSWWFLPHSAEVQISRMQNAEVFFGLTPL